MAVLFKLSKFSKQCKFIDKCTYTDINHPSSLFCTMVQQPVSKTLKKFSLIGASLGIIGGLGYTAIEFDRRKQNNFPETVRKEIPILDEKPDIKLSRQIVSHEDTTGLKLTLFQYQTCPFCCKVRTFLDYYGLSYDLVEVDPVLRKEISWSSYRKVPILLAQVDKGYQPLHDSSMIISLLASHIQDKSQKIDELAQFYPNVVSHDEDGNSKQEIMNKYFLMHKKLPSDNEMQNLLEERRWRKWADNVLVHVLSPNVYKTLDESYDTFNWFSKTGKWEEYFPQWERILMINVGACAMWLIGKRLKKKHNLKDDVRQSLYDEVNYWLKGIKTRGTPFMGGQQPGLSDLAVYGVLNSIEGCQAFRDLLSHTKIETWYNAMKEKVDTHFGSLYLNG